MRVLLIQASVFALIFFLAALVMGRGDVLRVLLMTVVATVVYTGLMGLMRMLWGGKKKM